MKKKNTYCKIPGSRRALGEFYLSEFEDNKHSNWLLTNFLLKLALLVLYPRHKMSIRTQQISKNMLAKKKPLKQKVERRENAG
jgi:hypothetical protein